MSSRSRRTNSWRGLYPAHGIAEAKEARVPMPRQRLLRTDGKALILCGATDPDVTALVLLSAKTRKMRADRCRAPAVREIVKACRTAEVRVAPQRAELAEIRSGNVESRSSRQCGDLTSRLPELPIIQEAEPV